MIFAPRSKTNSFSTTHTTKINFIPTLKSSQIWSPTLKWSQSGPHTHKPSQFSCSSWNKWFSASIQVASQLLPPTQPDQFNPFTEIKSSSIPHTEIKSISPITKTKSISMLTLKTSNFRPAHKNKVNFDPRTKHTPEYVNFGQFISPTQDQVHFDPYSKNRSIFHAPRHEN